MATPAAFPLLEDPLTLNATTRRWLRIGLLSLLGLALLLFGYALSNVFVPVLAALLIAYILHPVVNALEKLGVRRTLGVIVIYFALIISVAILVLILVPLLYTEIASVGPAMAGEPFTDANGNGRYDAPEPYTDENDNERYDPGEYYDDLNNNGQWDPDGEPFDDDNDNGVRDAGYVDRAWGYVSSLVGRWNQRHADEPAKQINLQNLVRYLREKSISLKEFATSGAKVSKWAAKTLAIGVGGVVSFIITILLIGIYTFLLLLSMNPIWVAIKAHLPGRYRETILDILMKIHASLSAFFRGRLIVCLLSAILTTIGVYFCGVRFSVVIGIIVGFGGLIPFVGVLAGLIPAVLLALADHGLGNVIGVVAVFIIVQSLEGWVFTPLIIGREVELHPLTIILSLFIGGTLFGLFGVLMSVPVACTAKILAVEFVLPPLRELAREKPADAAAGAD